MTADESVFKTDDPSIEVIVDVRMGATIIAIPATGERKVFYHGKDVGKATLKMAEKVVYKDAADAEDPDEPWEPLRPATRTDDRPPGYDLIREGNEEMFINNLYTVIRSQWVYPLEEDGPPMIHLSIRRNDRRPVTDWRHKQKIKNELVGPDHEGVELFPAEDRLVDTSNQFHLWVMADPSVRVPVGYEDGRVTCGNPIEAKAKQRPFVDGEHESITPEALDQLARQYAASKQAEVTE